jgi:hypothetical protein
MSVVKLDKWIGKPETLNDINMIPACLKRLISLTSLSWAK